MILMTARLIKILLCMVALAEIYMCFRKKANKKFLICLEILVVIFSIVANVTTRVLPSLTDDMTLVALGEKNNASNADEVFLAGYTVDGKTYVAGESLEITEGKWFWSGETYAWRNEADNRQPAGTTRSIKIQIPVGWSRTLNFDGNDWRGMAEISSDTHTWAVDTFSANPQMLSVEIGKSKTSSLIWNQIYKIVFYALVLFILTLSLHLVVCTAIKAQSWLIENKGKLIYASISIVIMIMMIHFADRYSLWIDELWEIYFIKGTWKEAMRYCINMNDIWPPFFTLSAWVWYRIAPYGERWLLLITIIPSALSIYLSGLIGEKLQGKTCGVLSAFFMGLSTTLWLNSAYEFRAYALLTACSTLTLFAYIIRNERRNVGSVAFFSFSLTALAMSHYFGMLCCAIFFLSDLFLLIKKRIKWHMGISYFLPGIASILWLGIVYICTLQKGEIVSSPSPLLTFSGILSILKFLTGNLSPLYFILLVGIGTSIFSLYKLKDNSFTWEEYYNVFFAVSIFFVISFIFILGNFINPDLTLGYERYFMELLPYISVLCAQTVLNVCVFIGKMQGRKLIMKKELCIVIGAILCANCLAVVKSPSSVYNIGGAGTNTTMPFREAADWIYTQSNYIYNEDTVIISTQGSEVPVAWEEYYITRQGRRDKLNHILMWDSIDAEEVLRYNRVYVNGNWIGIPYSLQTILNKYYTQESYHSDINVAVYVKSQSSE